MNTKGCQSYATNGKYGHNSITCPNKQNPNWTNDVNSETIPLVNTVVNKDGASVVANNSSKKFGLWMVVARKWRLKIVVDKENVTDLEMNQRNNINTASHFAALFYKPGANTAAEVIVQNPIVSLPSDQLNPLPIISTLERTLL